MNIKVNLLIIGTQKAGTTSLYHYLNQHADIYFPKIKEITYFVDDTYYSKGENYYHSFFSRYKNQRIVASSYVHMLPCAVCPERVYNYNPQMKLIVMLRNPIERAYSAYNYAIKNGWDNESNSFMQAFELEKANSKKNLNKNYDLAYFCNGLYYKHLSNWLRYFHRDNVMIIKDVDLKENPQAVLSKIFRWLQIKEQDNIDISKKYNLSGKPRWKLLQRFLLSPKSKLKSIMSHILNQDVRVFIRARILPKLYEFNTVDYIPPPLNSSEYEIIKKYFEADIDNLDKEFGIKFDLDG